MESVVVAADVAGVLGWGGGGWGVTKGARKGGKCVPPVPNEVSN